MTLPSGAGGDRLSSERLLQRQHRLGNEWLDAQNAGNADAARRSLPGRATVDSGLRGGCRASVEDNGGRLKTEPGDAEVEPPRGSGRPCSGIRRLQAIN